MYHIFKIIFILVIFFLCFGIRLEKKRKFNFLNYFTIMFDKKIIFLVKTRGLVE